MLTTNQRSIHVGLGEIAVTKDTTVVLTCTGLGSCIAMCVYDPFSKSGGLAHMLLPTCRTKYDISSPPVKYIDTGAPLLINRLLKQGSSKENLIVKITGGASMLQIPGFAQLDIGKRNIEGIKATLDRENIRIVGAEIGGGFGRSVQFFLDSGRIIVRAVSGSVIEL
jgi:chemotaxis protein CheD